MIHKAGYHPIEPGFFDCKVLAADFYALLLECTMHTFGSVAEHALEVINVCLGWKVVGARAKFQSYICEAWDLRPGE